MADQTRQSFSLNVTLGSGTGQYPSGRSVPILAETPPAGHVFDRWAGGEGQILDVYSPSTQVTMPSRNLAISAQWISANSSRMGDVDQFRAEIQLEPTNPDTSASHRAALYRWWRFLWHQGLDMSSFNPTAQKLLIWDDQSKEGCRAIDEGYTVLESIQAVRAHIAEVASEPGDSGSRTDWPSYHGTDGKQTGYSPDSGACQGKVAWRFPKGYRWNARPVLRDGQVFISAPGCDVIGFCLDACTGDVIWRARQYGTDFYKSQGSRWDINVADQTVMIRTGFFQESCFIVDRQTGAPLIQKRIGVETPFFSNAPCSSPVSSHSKRPGGHLSESDLVSVKRSPRAFALLDSSNGVEVGVYELDADLSGDPLISAGQVFACDARGTVYAFSTHSGDLQWTLPMKSPQIMLGLFEQTLFLGGQASQLSAVNAVESELLWTYECDETELRSRQFFSGVAVANQRVYVGTSSKLLLCLDLTSGNEVWRCRLTDWVRSRPFVQDNQIYVACLDSRLFSFSDLGDSCEPQWQTRLGEHGITADLVGDEYSILAVSRELVLYSVRPATGNIQWRHGLLDGGWIDGRYHAGDVIGGGFQSSPVIVDGVVFIGGPDGFVNAIDVDSGSERWRFEAGGNISASPTIAERKVFFGQSAFGDCYYALDQMTGQPVWQPPDFGEVWVGTAYARHCIYVGGKDGKMRCADTNNGTILWVYDAGKSLPSSGSLYGIYSNPAVDDQRIYFGSWAGFYEALDLETGQLIWQTKTCDDFQNDGKPDSAAPVLWRDHLYCQKLVERVVAIDKDSGVLVWDWPVPNGRFQNGTVAAGNEMLFVTASLGREIIPYESTIFAFTDIEHGSRALWTYSGGGGLTSPVLTHDKLIFGSTAGVFITCLNLPDGSLRWRVYTGGVIEESVPGLYGKYLIAQCRNGYLYCIE